MNRNTYLGWLTATVGLAASIVACGSDVETIGGGGDGGTGGTGTGTTSTGGSGNMGAYGGSGILPTGDCESSAECGGAECLELTPGGWQSCVERPVEATSCQEPSYDECCHSGQCESGSCLVAPVVPYCGGPQPLEYNVCATDQCTSDSDCADWGGICLPAPMLGRKVRACMYAACQVNADCTKEPGGYCAPVQDPCCGSPSGLYCVYPSNGCRSDGDCASGWCVPTEDEGICQAEPPACPA